MGAKVEVYRDGGDEGVQQLGVRALLPFSGVVLPTVKSKDGAACWFFSHPTLNNRYSNFSSCLVCSTTRQTNVH